MITLEKLIYNILQLLSPKTVTPMFGTATSTTGTIPPCSKVSITNSGAANGTITSNGTDYILETGEVITLDPGAFRRNEKITFDVSSTTIKYAYYK